MTNIILCGGSGTRLWPISRTLMPKQFVKLFDNQSLFQQTVERNAKYCTSHMIVSNTEQYFLALDQLEEMGKNHSKYILEPVGRDTAPAIALACMALDLDEIVLVTPSDHTIKNLQAYEKVLAEAKKLASEDCLVTFGITPTSAEIGFGYIKAEGNAVCGFYEKPDIHTAKQYVDSGDYYWNSGMFCFKAGVYLSELKKYEPVLYAASCSAYHNASVTEVLRIKHEDMFEIPEKSIDYAVMEKSEKVKVVPSSIDWSDVGSFDALFDELPKDKNNNTSTDKHISIGSQNNLIYASNRTIATIDIEDLIIVDTGDALLVSKKGSSQKVKEIVAEIKKTSNLHEIHLTGYRPWGTYTILDENIGYKIKRIEVKPGKRLSLQKHFHRNEHWIVISGTATVTVEEKTYLVSPNESTYIKMGEIHRLENKGKIPVILIEAQVGEYVGEDDIVRIEDDFNRAEH